MRGNSALERLKDDGSLNSSEDNLKSQSVVYFGCELVPEDNKLKAKIGILRV